MLREMLVQAVDLPPGHYVGSAAEPGGGLGIGLLLVATSRLHGCGAPASHVAISTKLT